MLLGLVAIAEAPAGSADVLGVVVGVVVYKRLRELLDCLLSGEESVLLRF